MSILLNMLLLLFLLIEGFLAALVFMCVSYLVYNFYREVIKPTIRDARLARKNRLTS